MNGYESLKRILGGVMIAIPFLLLFALSVLQLGKVVALVVWTGIAILFLWIVIAVCLLDN